MDYISYITHTLNSPIIVGQCKFIEPMLILMIENKVKIRMNWSFFEVGYILTSHLIIGNIIGHNKCFPRKVMWVIVLYCATFVLQVTSNVLVIIPYEDVGEDPRSWTHVNLTLTTKWVYPMLIFHPR